jgi:hypothetical protein
MPRKPISIWIGQILIALAWLFFTGTYIYFAALTWPTIITAVASAPWRLVQFLARTAAMLAAIALVGWTIVLISRRSPYGRWFGVFLLVLLFAARVYSSLNPSSPASLPSNDAERAGYLVGQALALVLYVVLLWCFGFSRASRAFFLRPHPAP